MALANRRSIDRLRADWDTIARSTASRHAAAQLSEAEVSIAQLGVWDLGALIDVLNQATSIPERERAADVFRALLRSGDVHPLVPRAALQALLPGLVSLARHLEWGRGGDWGDPGSFFSDLAALAWEVFVEWMGQDRPYAVLEVLSAVRCRARRQITAARQHHSRFQDIDDVDRFSVPVDSGSGDLELLARTIDDAPLSRFDAGVLYGTCVLGYTITDLSRLTGATRRRIGKRQRGAAREILA